MQKASPNVSNHSLVTLKCFSFQEMFDVWSIKGTNSQETETFPFFPTKDDHQSSQNPKLT